MDKRNQNYITYQMKTICITRLWGLLCGLTSMTDISSNYFNTDCCISNLSKICGQNLMELPYWKTIQDVFETIKIDELNNIQKYIAKALIRSKMFDKYKFDGIDLSNHNYNLNNNCLTRKHKDGNISYYKYVLECSNMAISLDSEFIENNKNDKSNRIKTTTFRYISNLTINDNNISEIVSLGKKRKARFLYPKA